MQHSNLQISAEEQADSRICDSLNSKSVTSRKSKRTFYCYFLYIQPFLIGSLKKSVDIPSLGLAVLGVRLITWTSVNWELISLILNNQITASYYDFKMYIIKHITFYHKPFS